VLAPMWGAARLAEEWETRYVTLRWADAGIDGTPEAAAGTIEGVLVDMGVINSRGERCLVLETRDCLVLVDSTATRLRVGSRIEVMRSHSHEPWAIRSR